MAEADRHGFEWPPPRARGQGAAALLQFDADGSEEAHLSKEGLLALGADLVGDLGHADVRAFLHDLGDGARAPKRMGVVDDVAVDVQLLRAIVDLAEALDDPT